MLIEYVVVWYNGSKVILQLDLNLFFITVLNQAAET